MREIDFNHLTEANKLIKTTDIKGKDYAEVNQRVKAFRYLFPDGTIETEMLSYTDEACVFKAVVFANGTLLGIGHAREEKASSFINKTSYIENCETSAVGRALAMCGIGIDVSIASAEEVTNAINNQTETKPNQKVTKPEPKANQTEPKGAYPTMEEMLALANEKYPEGSKQRAALLGCWGIEKLEDASQAQLMVIWNKYAGA